VKTRAIVGITDVHARALAYGIQTFQHLDAIGAVASAYRLLTWFHVPDSFSLP
jgi:hypothetical protein